MMVACAVSTTSSHCWVMILSQQMMRHVLVESLGRRARKGAKPGCFQFHSPRAR
jgi:hypothetical protein